MIIHYFLVEFGNSGDLYKVGCTGDKSKLLEYWYPISRDVRYYRERNTEDKVFGTKRKVKLGRSIGNIGNIVSCDFFCDFPQSIDRSKRLRVFDERYPFYNDEKQ